MGQDRRTFLKTTALAGAAVAAGATSMPALAQRAAAPAGAPQMPHGLVLATLRRSGGYGLGVRTERGILDVAAAEASFHENAPTTIHALLKGDGEADGIKRLVD